MTTKFYLRDAGAETPTAIFAIVHANGVKVKLQLRKSIVPKDWNSSKQRASKSSSEYIIINSAIDKLTANASQAYQTVVLEEGENFTAEQFKQAYENIVNSDPKNRHTKKKKDELPFFELFEEFINADSRGRKTKGKNKTESSKAQYQSTASILKEFNPNLKIQNITEALLEDFSNYLFEERENQQTSVYNRINHIKIFMKWADEKKKVVKNKDYLQFSVSKAEAQHIALTMQEIEKIQNLTLEDAHLDHSRDLFILQFYTGRRYSDIKLLKKEHFRTSEEGRGFFDFFDEKTKKWISVPLANYAMKIIEKYEMDFQPVNISNQNANIKKICQLAGINEKIEKLTTFKKETQRKFIEKWESVATHTSRRSFITYAHSQGLTINEIAELTGQSLAVVQKYIVYTDKNKVSSIDKMFGSK